VNVVDANSLLKAALAKCEATREFASSPLASRDYARYAQAAYTLRHAQRVLNRALQQAGVGIDEAEAASHY
jgi:hypothetical protein